MSSTPADSAIEGTTRIAPATEAIDDIRVSTTTTTHTTTSKMNAGHASQRTIPAPVATPLPPLKRCQMGKQCPSTAAAPAA